MYDFLKMVPLFAALPDTDLAMLCQMVDEVDIKAGDVLFTEGSRGDRAYVIESGRLEIVKTAHGREVLLAMREAGEVIGEMSLLESSLRSATARAFTDARLLAIHQDQLDKLLNSSPSAARVMLHTVLARARADEASLRQSLKMAQLGTLTAGVAHELNNPAAAVKRGVDQFSQALSDYVQTQLALSQLNLSAPQQAKVRAMEEAIQQQTFTPPYLPALQRSDLEYALESWLDDHGVENSWALAPTLVDLGYTTEYLAALAADFPPQQLPAVITGLGASNTIYSLMGEISQGAARISEIIKALKTYSYLDQAPIQEVNVHEGIDSTLVILRSKLKAGVMVRKEYAPDLPRISAYGSELNQVWTNILDNAADAMNGQGEVIIRTRQAGTDWITVEIQDSGPGIAQHDLVKVFDPFFTTKPPGQGTGLGLNISYNIVVQKHRGDIKVFSRPGRTLFQIWLPVSFDKVKSTLPGLSVVQSGDDAVLRRILEQTRTIAVVGFSNRPDRPANSVPVYLQRHGYRVIPVNPRLAATGERSILGEPAYADLRSIPEPVDLVQIFRRAEDAPPIVDDAIAIGARVIWMQMGIINEQAADTALAAGLEVVMDQCMLATHKRLFKPTGS
jgi:signal transduction histidine kinase/predicted CoA-binding protein